MTARPDGPIGPALRRRAALLRAVRTFFEARGFLEVQTPCAVSIPGEEVHLRAFETRREYPDGTPDTPLWLRTSPEFAMKRLLASGSGAIFQIGPVWRNGEAGPLHAPEFTMLEWYRPGQAFDGLLDETEALVRAVLPPRVTRRGTTVSLDGAFERLTIAEAFRRHAGGLDILADPGDADALAGRAGTTRRGDPEGWQEDWEDLFFRLLLERVEPAIGRDRPTFLTHWPAAQAALARRDPDDPRVALRVELYACGVELANAFDELTDAAEQRTRFVADRARRATLAGRPPQTWPLDERLLAALAHLPPCCGAALGFDRLALLAAGANSLAEVTWLGEWEAAGK